MYKGIEQAVAGKRVGDIGAAIQEHVSKYGFGIVRELVGHGVGFHLHENLRCQTTVNVVLVLS
ncbi:hypothetical protein L950_0226055 [Sphingobacterium sp. IITKGP-BTPF85]|nr:hypothetical protein L950_0226055 [Sphingobacterium sp. IITKGP-BTPF85]